ncbi:hypothetical protein, partial [Aeromonas caviae]
SKQESGIKRRSSHFSCVNTVPVNTYYAIGYPFEQTIGRIMPADSKLILYLLVLNRLSMIMVITTDKHNERLAVMLAKVSRIKTVINLWQT